MRFFGATFDPSGLYRFNAVMRWIADVGIDFAAVHSHVERLQARFLAGLAQSLYRLCRWTDWSRRPVRRAAF
jgi:selenocysteine lyase/cysteine desulfurase